MRQSVECRRLFMMAARAARELGAEKMYITANASRESQAFYRAMGCVEAAEPVPALLAEEPNDVHMEYRFESLP
jgi:N-acetylglutamate synthase-like GNAT family acetyltransferase